MSDYSVDLLYETLTFQTLEAIICFLCVDEMESYLRNRELFSDIPLSNSIIDVTSKFTNNQNIQRQSMYILCYFARSGVETQIILQKSGMALKHIISCLYIDSSVVSQFIYVLNVMLRRGRKLSSGSDDRSSISAVDNTRVEVEVAEVRKHGLDLAFIGLLASNCVGPEVIFRDIIFFLH